MWATIITGLFSSGIFKLFVSLAVKWIDKVEMDKQAKRDFYAWVEAFNEHRDIPVKLNEQWAKIIKVRKEELEGTPYSEV